MTPERIKRHPEDDPITLRCFANLHAPEETTDDLIAGVHEIEEFYFGENGFSEERLRTDFSSPENVVVLLRDPEAEAAAIIGFSYAVPVERMYPASFPERQILPGTAYVNDTAIAQAYHGHHLVGKLVGTLESELKQRGYTHIERDAAVNNNYAANIRRQYGDRVEEAVEHNAPEGDQVFFRIRLE